MSILKEHYFKNRKKWRAWLAKNHATSNGVYLIFYKVDSEKESMRWEEAVQEALCFGWIDSKVQRINEEKRRQVFTPRKAKSGWSKLNKSYIVDLIKNNEMQESGLMKIENAKKDGSWTLLDDVENLVVPKELQQAFDNNQLAFKHYKAFSKTYRKSYLYWLNQAKRQETREKRIKEIIDLCERNIKSR